MLALSKNFYCNHCNKKVDKDHGLILINSVHDIIYVPHTIRDPMNGKVLWKEIDPTELGAIYRKNFSV